MPLTTTDANNVLDSRFGGGAAAVTNAPATYYVGLSTTTPAADGSNVTEPSGNAYAPVAVTNNSTNWPAASARSKANGVAIVFPTATGSWGTVTHYVIKDGVSGTVRAYGALAVPKTINVDAVPTLAIGAVVISVP